MFFPSKEGSPLAQKIRAVIRACIFVSVLGILYPVFVSAAVYQVANHSTGGAINTGVDSNGYTYQFSKSGGDYEAYGSLTLPEFITGSAMAYFWIITEDTTYASGMYMNNNGGTPAFTGVVPIRDNTIVVDGVSLHAYQFAWNQCTGGCGTGDLNFTDFRVAYGSTKRMYGLVTAQDSSNSIVDATSMYIALGFFTPPPSGATTTQIVTTAASLYSQKPIIVDPTTTTSYSFTSSLSDTAQHQGGVVMVSHLATTTPAVSWGGTPMTLYSDTESTQGYELSLYYVPNPASSSTITITGIAAASVNFISQTVWTNGDHVATFDQRNIIPGSLGTIDLASLSISPTTLVGSMYTPYPGSFTITPATTLMYSATNTQATLDVIRRTCTGYAGLVDCPMGYTPSPYAFPFANLVGIALYSSVSTTTGNVLGVTPVTYQNCETFDVGCYISNAGQYLFAPSTDSVTQFGSLTLASSTPFSYLYDVPQVVNELFNTSTTTEINFAIDLGLSSLTGTSSEIVILSKPILESIPYVQTIRFFLSASLWLATLWGLYEQIRGAYAQGHPV